MQQQWKTKDGRLLNPSDMATGHIKNALGMLKRAGVVGPSTVSFYSTCSMPQGEMAIEAFLGEHRAVLNAPVSEFVDVFESILVERSK